MMMHTYKLQTTNMKVAGRQPLNESQKENGGTGAAPSPSETAAHTRPSHWGRAMVHPSTSPSHAAAQLGSLARLVGRRLAQGKKPSGHPYIIHPSYQLIQPTSPSGLCRGSNPPSPSPRALRCMPFLLARSSSIASGLCPTSGPPPGAAVNPASAPALPAPGGRSGSAHGRQRTQVVGARGRQRGGRTQQQQPASQPARLCRQLWRQGSPPILDVAPPRKWLSWVADGRRTGWMGRCGEGSAMACWRRAARRQKSVRTTACKFPRHVARGGHQHEARF